jgi:hypothetical protein
MVVVSDQMRYYYLTDDPDTGGWTRQTIRPAGRVGGVGHEQDFEYHSPQEEIFFLRGSVQFGDFYRIDAPGYLSHPPYWLHPSEQRFAPEQDTYMLVRLSMPIDTTYVPIPPDWDGKEYCAQDVDFPRGRGISALQLSDVTYGPVRMNGKETGEEAGVLFENPADDVITWLWRVSPGWRGDGAPWQLDGASDEVYVLEGDLTTAHDERQVNLAPGSYYCYSDVLYDGGGKASSNAGLLAVRWTKRVPGIELPPLGHSKSVG